MAPAKMSNKSTWVAGVQDIASAAGISESKLAAAAGLNRQTLYRYLGGNRGVTPQVVRAINVALGMRLLGDPTITTYLDAAFAQDNAEGGGGDFRITVKNFNKSLEYLCEIYLRPEAGTELVNEILALPSAKQRWRILTAISAAQRKQYVQHLLGEGRSPGYFNAMKAVFGKYGIDLDRWLRPEEGRLFREVMEDVHEVVCDAVMVIEDRAVRYRTELVIMQAHATAIHAIADLIRSSLSNRLDELKSADKRKERKR